MAGMKRGLGKGLDGIIVNKPLAKKENEESAVKNAAVMVDIKKINNNKKQPRKKFDEDALEELSESIKQHGIIQPIVVQDRKTHYEIIAGERRWRAAIKAGLTEVPVIIKDYTELEIFEISLIENLQRQDLDPIEEAQAYKRLKTEYKLTDDQVAEKVSKSRAAVTNSMRLLKLSEKVQMMLVEDQISTGHARALLVIDDPEKQYEIAQDIFDQKLSVRDVEKLIRNLNKPQKVKKEKNLEKYKVHYDDYASKLAEKLSTKVSVSLKDKSAGKLEIEFYSNDEFEKIFNLLNKKWLEN